MGEERNEGNTCQKIRLGSQGKSSVPVVRGVSGWLASDYLAKQHREQKRLKLPKDRMDCRFQSTQGNAF